ncbi:hypothetical protein IWZ01DRAFT_111100 [Phyllosticta capitalensis]
MLDDTPEGLGLQRTGLHTVSQQNDTCLTALLSSAMTPLHASSPTSITSNASANAASLDPSDPQITLWTRLWPCTRSQAISRIAATRQIMMLRSSDKAAAKDRKWDQVKHTWERQGIGRLEWEHLEMVGGFGGHDSDEGPRGRGLGLDVRGAGRGDEENDHDGIGSRRPGAGDVSPISPSTSTSTSTSGSTNASPTTVISPPPPPPSSPSSLQSQNSPSTSFRHSNQSSTAADEEIFQATLSIVDAHGVDRGAAVAKAVWIVLRDHLECVRLGAECAVACLVCRLIRAKFERIREEFGGYAGHEGRRGRASLASRTTLYMDMDVGMVLSMAHLQHTRHRRRRPRAATSTCPPAARPLRPSTVLAMEEAPTTKGRLFAL